MNALDIVVSPWDFKAAADIIKQYDLASTPGWPLWEIDIEWQGGLTSVINEVKTRFTEARVPEAPCSNFRNASISSNSAWNAWIRNNEDILEGNRSTFTRVLREYDLAYRNEFDPDRSPEEFRYYIFPEVLDPEGFARELAIDKGRYYTESEWSEEEEEEEVFEPVDLLQEMIWGDRRSG